MITLRSRYVALVVFSAVISFVAPAIGQEVAENEPLATVGDASISRAEVEAQARGLLLKLEQERYEILRNALEQAIEDRLLEAHAKKAGTSGDELLTKTLESVPEPTEAEIESFFNENRKRLGGQSLVQARGRIVQVLKAEKENDALDELYASLRKETPVKIMLMPPRTEVAVDDDPSIGPADAPVTIIAFTDYQCPYCSKAEATVSALVEEFEGKVRLVVRDYPLDFHKFAQKAAEAAGCADEQGKFKAMHEKLFANQNALAEPDLNRYAQELGLDEAEFQDCLDSGRRAEEVAADMEDGIAAGVGSTPWFFINGRGVRGAQSKAIFSEIIEDELARAGS